MPRFRIPYTYMEWGYMDIEAPNIEEAKRIVLEDATMADLHLQSSYVDDSLAIDKDSAILGELDKDGHVIRKEEMT